VNLARPDWLRGTVLAVAVVTAAAGFGQYGVTATLGDVATAFGDPGTGEGVLAEIGITGTRLGIGLAIIRAANLASLPATALADRVGRRTVLLGGGMLGLLLTAAAALSPNFWWFVAIFAAGRPLLSASVTISGVHVAEQARAAGRASAVAFVTAAYAVGTGVLAVVRSFGLDFRTVFAAALVPMVIIGAISRWVPETEHSAAAREHAPSLPGAVPSGWRGRVALVCVIHLAIGLLEGPVNGYIFLYGEQVLGLQTWTVTAVFLASGATGLVGLLIGRWGSDRFGRRVTAGTALATAAALGAATYAGPEWLFVIGFPLVVTANSALSPAAGALDAEVFTSRVRATAAGWLTASQVVGTVLGVLGFGLFVDRIGTFGGAALLIAVPAILAATLYALLPETRGRQLDAAT
jgi:putative MFS transporter